MKNIAISSALAIFGFGGFVVYKSITSQELDLIALGNFIILGLTLIALIAYAYDTNSIARITLDRWKLEGVFNVSCAIEFISTKEGDEGRTLFKFRNSSARVINANANCNFRVYGHPVEWGPMYSGKEEWLLFPHEDCNGWFLVGGLVQKQGKSVANMIAESTPANREIQLTMNLEVEYRDELGERRKLPGRKYYFDFGRWVWIPHLGVAAQER